MTKLATLLISSKPKEYSLETASMTVFAVTALLYFLE